MESEDLELGDTKSGACRVGLPDGPGHWEARKAENEELADIASVPCEA